MSSRLPPALANATFPPAVLGVLRTLGDAGHRSWLVGGAVRDLLLHRPRVASDFDVATPATPQQVQQLFRKTIPTGVEHGTVTVVVDRQHVEVTTFRGEGAYVDGRRPSSVTFHADVDQDLARRDFTMNALAFDPLAGELRDPFGGRADLAARLVRAVGDPAARFGEDGLRPLRAVRFAAQLDFALDPATQHAIPGALPVTGRVSAERISDELTKLLLAPHAARGIELLDATSLLDAILPELAPLAPDRRGHAVRAAAAAPGDLALRLAGLLHVLAADGAPDRAATGTRAALVRLRFPGEVVDRAAALVAIQGCLLAGPREVPATPADARRWLARAGAAVEGALALWRVDAWTIPAGAGGREARATQRRAAVRLRRALAAHPPLTQGDLAVDGRAIMRFLDVPPGPAVGAALRHLLELVLEDPRRNTRPSLEEALRAWHATRGGPAR